ncbi:uncharacterized protein N7482_010749 [Penicillium canariense]|uniref:Uncharacterized protein n=1 Tax=Penicillium canariense TaxID=189055 RepID=A0A9W9HNE5_9EURO|nr:uncharacterized protein N7482_010749 [Penicillium canariense]KAJ5151497.1 hypothetical protein N7482_010749 [Penicillium canariense]
MPTTHVLATMMLSVAVARMIHVPTVGANTNFHFTTDVIAGAWAWESGTIGGVNLHDNGLLTWNAQSDKVQSVCIAYKNNGGYFCYERPGQAACVIDTSPENIDDMWGFP